MKNMDSSKYFRLHNNNNNNIICGLLMISMISAILASDPKINTEKLLDPLAREVSEKQQSNSYDIFVRLKFSKLVKISFIDLELRDNQDQVMKLRLVNKLEPGLFSTSLESESALIIPNFVSGRLRAYSYNILGRQKNVTPSLVAQQVNNDRQPAVDFNLTSSSDPETKKALSAHLCIVSGILDRGDSWLGLSECKTQ